MYPTPPPPPPERPLRVLLCGYGHLGFALLQGLLACADLCEVVGVFRWSSRPESADCWEPVEGEFQQMVESVGLRDIQCGGMNGYEFSELLQRLRPDMVLVGAWGEIIKPHLLDQPGLLMVNCHPSRLPAHRGANPYASVILAGEAETGVTFHRMARKIDAGAILLQQTVPIDPHDTGAGVRDRCVAAAQTMVPVLVRRVYEHLNFGEPLEEQAQSEAEHSYYPPLKTEDGLVDWGRTAEGVYRQFRALYPWTVCYSYLAGKRVVLFYDPRFVPRPGNLPAGHPPGTILAFEKGVIWVALSEPDWVMAVSAYQIQGGRAVLPAWLTRWVAGWLFRPGQRFGNPA